MHAPPVHGDFKADPPYSELPPARSQADRVIESLLLLEELLADKATAPTVVDFLHEPTCGEQLFRVSRALQLLNDLKRALEDRRPPRLVS